MRPPSQETPRLTSWPTPSLPLVCGDWHEADLWSQICGPCGANPSTEQPGLETQASSLSSGWYSWPCLELISGSELKVLSPETSPSHPNSFFSPLGLGSTDSTKMLVIPDLNVDLCVCVCVCVRSVVSDSLLHHGLYPPGSSVHGISQACSLEWVAISFSKGSS